MLGHLRPLLLIAAFTLIAGPACANLDYFYSHGWEHDPASLEKLQGPPTYAAADENNGMEMWYPGEIAGYPVITTYFFTADGYMTEICIDFDLKNITPEQYQALHKTLLPNIANPEDPFTEMPIETDTSVVGYSRLYRFWYNQNMYVEMIEMLPLENAEYGLYVNFHHTNFWDIVMLWDSH